MTARMRVLWVNWIVFQNSLYCWWQACRQKNASLHHQTPMSQNSMAETSKHHAFSLVARNGIPNMIFWVLSPKNHYWDEYHWNGLSETSISSVPLHVSGSKLLASSPSCSEPQWLWDRSYSLYSSFKRAITMLVSTPTGKCYFQRLNEPVEYRNWTLKMKKIGKK